MIKLFNLLYNVIIMFNTDTIKSPGYSNYMYMYIYIDLYKHTYKHMYMYRGATVRGGTFRPMFIYVTIGLYLVGRFRPAY